MALKALTMDRVVDYVSDLDPAKGTDSEATEATVFQLGVLSARQMQTLKDAASSFRPDPNPEDSENPDMIAEFRPNHSTLLMVQYGLKGWKRFFDSDGDEVRLSFVQRQLGGKPYQVVSEECLDMLGQELIRELAEKIEDLNKPEQVDLKT